MVDLEESFTSLDSFENGDARVVDIDSPLLDQENNDVLDVEYVFNQGDSEDVLDEELGSFSSVLEQPHLQDVVEEPRPVALAAEVVVAPEPNLRPLVLGILPMNSLAPRPAEVCPVALDAAGDVNPCPVQDIVEEPRLVALAAEVVVAPSTPPPLGTAQDCPAALAGAPIVNDEALKLNLCDPRNPSYVHLDLPPRRPYTSPDATHVCNCQMKSVPEKIRGFLREGTADELSKGTVFLASHRKDKSILKDSDAAWRLAVCVAKLPLSGNIRYRLLTRSEFPGCGLPIFFDEFAGRNGRVKTCNSNSKPSTFLIRCIGDRPHFYLLPGSQGISE